MNRRRFLAALGVASVSGCRSPDPPTPGTGVSVTVTRGQGESSRYELVGYSFGVETFEPGLDANTATVSFPDGGIRVTGVVRAPTTCHTARLTDRRVHPEVAQLEVAIESYERTAVENCADEPVGIRYESLFEFADLVPGHVTVRHDGTPVNDGPEID